MDGENVENAGAFFYQVPLSAPIKKAQQKLVFLFLLLRVLSQQSDISTFDVKKHFATFVEFVSVRD